MWKNNNEKQSTVICRVKVKAIKREYDRKETIAVLKQSLCQEQRFTTTAIHVATVAAAISTGNRVDASSIKNSHYEWCKSSWRLVVEFERIFSYHE